MAEIANKSVERSVHIIDVLAETGGITLSELSEQIDMPVSTVHDYLQSLSAVGFVAQEDNEYHLTTKFLEIGYKQLHRSEIYTAARPELTKLADETGEHITLMIEEGGEGVLIDVQEGDKAVDFLSYPGSRMPLHACAPGKAILAYMNSDRIDEILDRNDLPALTRNTITDPAVLRDQLAEIREQGYAVDEGERIAGMVLVAAPILDREERPRASICIAGPRNRFDESRQSELSSLVKEAVNVVQIQIDYS